VPAWHGLRASPGRQPPPRRFVEQIRRGRRHTSPALRAECAQLNGPKGRSVSAARVSPHAIAVTTALAGRARDVAVSAVLGIDQDIGEAASLLFRTVEAKEASVDHAGFALATRNGIGQPARGAARRGTAVSLVGLVDAFARAQLSTGAAALVDVRGIDDQRATQCTQPARSKQRSDQRTSKHQNCPRQSSESPSRLALIVGPEARAPVSTTGRRR